MNKTPSVSNLPLGDYVFDPKDWEDPFFRGRLSPRCGDLTRDDIDYTTISQLLENTCPHFTTIHLDHGELMAYTTRYLRQLSTAHSSQINQMIEDEDSPFRPSKERREWCAVNCTGYWMDGDYGGMMGRHTNTFFYSFEKDVDLVMFKLRWYDT